jgi:branched-subunit amino acid transport protein
MAGEAQMNIWLVLIICGVMTYLTRLSFIAAFGKHAIPEWLRRSLRFVPAAVLSVIACQSLFYPADHFDISWSNTRLLAGIIAALVAWRTRNALLTILVGMVALLAFNYFLHV